MATTDFSKINWGDYQNWEQVATPSGEMFYLVPGTGWAYNPFMSAQTGRVQLFPNPKLALQKQAEQEAEIKKAKEDAEKKSGIGYQILQTAIPAGVSLGTKYAYDKWLDPQTVTETASKIAAGNGSSAATSEAGKSWLDSISNSIFGNGSTSATSSVNAAAPVATTGAGEVGASMMPEMSASNVLGAAATAKGIYDTSKALDNGGEGLRTGLAEVGAGIGGLMFGPIGAAGGAALGSWAGYGLDNQSNWKGALSPVGGLNAIANLFDVKLVHTPIKMQQADRWGKLADKGVTGAKEAFMQSLNMGELKGKMSSGANKGKEWNWEDATLEAQRDPAQFRNVYGNFDTFGNDWATYAPLQQDEIVKRLLAENLYDPEKGDINIIDQDRAREIKDEVLASDPATSVMNKTKIEDPTQNLVNPNITAGIPGARTTMSGVPVTFKTANPYQALTGLDPVDIGKKLANRFNFMV